MKRPTLRGSFLGAAALVALAAAGCTTPDYENNHWHINHVAPRIAYHFAGYRQSVDGPYIEKLGEDMEDVQLTLLRHLLNYNPENPLMPVPTPKPYQPVPPDVEFKVKNP
jgi:hypothetical protein